MYILGLLMVLVRLTSIVKADRNMPSFYTKWLNLVTLENLVSEDK